MYQYKKFMGMVALVTIFFFSNYEYAAATDWSIWPAGAAGATYAFTSGSSGVSCIAASTPAWGPILAVGAVIVAVAAAGYLIYSYNRNQAKTVDANKNIKLGGAEIHYVDLESMDMALTGGATHVNTADIENAAIATPSKYPNLAVKAAPVPTGENHLGYGVGAIVPQYSSAGLNNVSNNIPYAWVNIDSWSLWSHNGITYLDHKWPSSDGRTYSESVFTTADAYPSVAPSSSSFADSISSNGTVQTTFSGEIDDVIKDNPNIVSFDNVPVINNVANNVSVITQAVSQAQKAASDALAAAASAVISANSAASSVQSALAANNQAQSANAAAQAALAAAQAAMANAANSQQVASAQAALSLALANASATQSAADAAARAADSALIAAATGNGAAVAKSLSDLATAEQAIANAQQGHNNLLQGIADEQKKQDEKGDSSAYSPSGAPGAYGDGSTFDFGPRVKKFVDAVKATGVFDVADKFGAGIPTSGGEAILSFDGGIFGRHEFNFAIFSTVFATLKALWLVICSWVGVKIITLKGGSL